ncbi:hypothetical protein GGS24DRAFT_187196 [Hypoxylon argillaceum]|nr:hypothetical protein GGS24DRAFT_187196 [Hypoxylon argillaceum]
MSSPWHSQGARREVPRPRYEDQDSLMYRAQGTQGNFSDFRTSDMNESRHDSLVHRERKYRPSHGFGHSSSRSQRDDLALYNEGTIHRSIYPPDPSPADTKRSKGHRAKSYGEDAQVQKSWVEAPTFLRSSALEPPESNRLSSPRTIREKTVRFDDNVYLDTGSPDRFPSTVRHRRDKLRGQSEDYIPRALGNGGVAGEFAPRGDYRNTVPKSSRAGERQASYVPAAPVIPRLPTPDFDSTCHHKLGLDKYDFCPCCISDDRDQEYGAHRQKGKTKMDKQVDHARSYMSRVTMSERLITDA